MQRSGRPKRPNRGEEIYMVLNHEWDLGRGEGELTVRRLQEQRVKRKHKVV
jgi:hypothetical protein